MAIPYQYSTRNPANIPQPQTKSKDPIRRALSERAGTPYAKNPTLKQGLGNLKATLKFGANQALTGGDERISGRDVLRELPGAFKDTVIGKPLNAAKKAGGFIKRKATNFLATGNPNNEGLAGEMATFNQNRAKSDLKARLAAGKAAYQAKMK